MALRVLLADENVTIKKVIQLSLQDYAVNVKSVNLGVDVLDVAREFKPDVVFADILLQKRNGYEVCTDFKQDAELSQVPFVLMWSSFMELDPNRFQSCGADGEIEKPFDREALRSIVQKTVEKLQSNSLPGFIEPPSVPKMDISPPAEVAEPLKPTDHPPGGGENWNMDSFDDIEEFVQKPLSQATTPESPAAVPPPPPTMSKSEDWSQAPTAPITDEPPAKEDQWAQSDLNQFKLDLDADPSPSPASEFSIDLTAGDKPEPPAADIPTPAPTAPALAEQELERIIRAQSTEVIESIAWKVIPDLAEKIIREKLDQLMKEAEL